MPRDGVILAEHAENGDATSPGPVVVIGPVLLQHLDEALQGQVVFLPPEMLDGLDIDGPDRGVLEVFGCVQVKEEFRDGPQYDRRVVVFRARFDGSQ